MSSYGVKMIKIQLQVQLTLFTRENMEFQLLGYVSNQFFLLWVCG